MSSRSRSWDSNRSRSLNRSLADGNRRLSSRRWPNRRWPDRRWNRWPRYRYPYRYRNYPYYPILDPSPITVPLANNVPVRWFYRYPYYYYYYGFPYNRWYQFYYPIDSANPLYIPPNASNLTLVSAADQTAFLDNAIIYSVPEGFEAETTKTVVVEGPASEERAQDYALSDMLMYDNMVKNNNTNYFMYGVLLLILILFLVILFN